jgi:hypothetical protein
MGGKAPKPPDMTPMIEMYRELGSRYMDQADRQFAMQERRYDELAPFERQIMQGQIDGQNLGMEQAREAFDFTRNTVRPMQQEMIDSARNFNTEGERERLAGQAAGDVEQSLSVQRGSAMRQLERMGVNPNSGRFAQLLSGTGLDAARMRAGSMNQARTQARNEGQSRMMQAYGVASGVPGYGLTALGSAGGLGAQAIGSMGAADRVGNIYGQAGMSALQGYGSAVGGMGSMTNQGYQNQMSAYNAKQSMYGGIGNMIGMAGMFMRDGGLVSGPGTGTSDSVPAVNTDSGQPLRVSNGEYVLPAQVVRAIGVDRIDEIVTKTTGKPPVHRQRALRR